MTATAHLPSPEPFRLWSAITAISGVLERKTWTHTKVRPLYPHLYTLLIGTPGTGKTVAVTEIKDLYRHIDGLYIAPDNVTKAKLIDIMQRSLRTVLINNEEVYSFCGLNVLCDEFGVFFTHHDTEFLSVMSKIYDSPPSYLEERVGPPPIKREVDKPHMVMLAATQPDFLGTFLPEEAWGQGFMSRMIMIFSSDAVDSDIFGEILVRDEKLAIGLQRIFNLQGEFIWEPEASDLLNQWKRSGGDPRPTHNRLLHYNERRPIHVLKLSMIAAVSRRPKLHVIKSDVERAIGWILAAEARMPDVFYAMRQKSDEQLLRELHRHCYLLYSSVVRDKRKPITTEQLWKFLHAKVTSDKIPKLIEAAVNIGYLKPHTFPGEYVPRPIEIEG